MDNYDKITNKTLDKAYKKFLKINEKYGKNFLKKFKNNEIYPAYT